LSLDVQNTFDLYLLKCLNTPNKCVTMFSIHSRQQSRWINHDQIKNNWHGVGKLWKELYEMLMLRTFGNILESYEISKIARQCGTWFLKYWNFGSPKILSIWYSPHWDPHSTRRIAPPSWIWSTMARSMVNYVFHSIQTTLNLLFGFVHIESIPTKGGKDMV